MNPSIFAPLSWLLPFDIYSKIVLTVMLALILAWYVKTTKGDPRRQKKRYRDAFVKKLLQEAMCMTQEERNHTNWVFYVRDACDALPEDTEQEWTIKYQYFPYDENNDLCKRLITAMTKRGLI